ncbi:hypothetical protein PVAND_013149 [Polypedilum vanderplanki]|uniref:CUB domain-containing protein n=1 Tax=Polypedilum vanderplanki TaxID=319348 RepID=A0A9J6CNS4_POLVA|nr:hypothetical protein PVAND_013149 [Polypedilum vanderplanki]
MKSHIWIILLISISSYIGATSNESTSAAVKFIFTSLSSSTSASALTMNSREELENTGGILTQQNLFSSNMSSAMTPTKPSYTTSSIHHQYTTTISLFSTLPSYLKNFYNNNNNDNPLKRKYLSNSKTKRSAEQDREECDPFIVGDEGMKTFYSPGHPGEYTKNISCVRVIEAPLGFQIRLDFRDYFQIEPSDDCKFDYLEIRDGAHGFGTLLGQFCGHSFPDVITSKDRFLWLRFNSDENIEDKGFKAVYEFIPRPTSVIYDETNCTVHVGGYEGHVDNSMVNPQKLEYVKKHNLSLDCMFIITVEENWMISLKFEKFELKKPNECEKNFIDVFPEKTDLPSRIKSFCGSMADMVSSKSNIVHIRYFAEASAINSTFEILYTAFRDKGNAAVCKEDEFDCEDSTCIKDFLFCNERENCRFKWDEAPEKCDRHKNTEQSEHVVIIIIVFGVILTILAIAFVVNCMRKIIRDHKIIREHIRQSRESKLDELGRHSTKLTKSRENIALQQLTKLPPPAFDLDSPTALNLMDSTTNHYYRDANNGARIIDSKNDLNLREQEIKNILGTSYDVDGDHKDAEMCDSACQTRESLFQPVFKNKVTQSPLPSGLRFSTFGYLDSSSTPSPPPPPNIHSIVNTAGVASLNQPINVPCPTHSSSGKNTLPHQHHQHLHSHHHSHRMHSGSTNQSSNDKGSSAKIDEQQQQQPIHEKYSTLRKDDSQSSSSRSYSDVRKSAPDVVIISGCTSSH